MKAIVVPSPGGPSVLELRDISQRSETYARPVPFVPGGVGAGRVVAGVPAGDRVAWEDVPGSYAECVAVPVAKALPIPDTITDEEGDSLPLQGPTAHYLAATS
ncbi:hypothetical protein ABZ912_22995 [Nonomuraea angiospora]|uniref:hypothetical protein n=1 Tax=Nonomuraea angiospora TaxID=46172 RepID=UPI0033FEB336